MDLLNYYRAIERCSEEMLDAARGGHWDDVLGLEGACAVLIGELKLAARGRPLAAEAARCKSRIMRRILLNDAELRRLAEPWIEQLDRSLGGRPRTVH